jgi:aminopeptidase N
MRNPNRVRSLIGAFTQGNPFCFHEKSGGGYAFIADHIIELDAMNPQVAARMIAPLSRWKRFEPDYQQLMREQLERINRQSRLSNDVREIISKSLETYDQ